MAHFAKLNEENKVTMVIVVANENILDSEGNESETIANTFINGIDGLEGTWKQTSYNSNFRGTFAGIGSTYDSVNDVFIAPVMEITNE
jgi:hypothetical protein